MKKIIIAILALFMVVSFTTIATAETDATTTGGEALELAGTNDPGPAFSFSPSPSTIMAVDTGENTYAATSASIRTTTDTGIEYGVLSTSNDMFQMAQAADNAVQAPTDASTLPDGFVNRAGNAPGGETTTTTTTETTTTE